MQKTFNSKLIKFTATDGIKLEGLLLGVSRKCCVVFVHGMGSNFYKNEIPFSISLGHEFSVFSINTRGHDILTTCRTTNGKRRILAGTGAEVFKDCIKDIKGAVDFLESIGFKDIILSGHSTGCQKIVHYMYKKRDMRISKIILFAPADDYAVNKKHLGSGFKDFSSKLNKFKIKKDVDTPLNKYGFFTLRRMFSAYSLESEEANIFYYDGRLYEFSKLKIPILALFGNREENKDRNVKEYMKILKDKTSSECFESVVIKDARHSFNGHEDELLDSINKWLKKTVKK